MERINLKAILITACCFVFSLFSIAKCMDDHTDKLGTFGHVRVGVTDNDQDNQKLIDRITKKIDKYERKADDLKILLAKFKNLEIDEESIHKTPESVLIDHQTTPLYGGEKKEQPEFIQKHSDSGDLDTLKKIMEVELNDYSQKEIINILAPQVKIGTNSTNIYRSIIGGTRLDSPPRSCIENYLKWKKQRGTSTNPRRLGF